MNTSGHHLTPPSASRLSGLGLAVGIHVLAAIGFASVFVVQQSKPPVEPPTVKVVKDEPLPPDPPPTIKPTQVRFGPSTTPEVPPIPFDIAPPTTPTIAATVESNAVRDFVPTQASNAQPPARTTAGPQTAGAVCTKMIAPVMPNVNGSGEALFRVTAATHAGRVTSLEIQALRSSMDGRSLRAFKSSIETALREGYECPGNVSFVQEFQFRLD